MTAVLCIGGLDPAGRAGLLADARAVAAQGARPLCVATALTYQSSTRVDGFHPTSPDVLEKQITPLLRDEAIGAVKIGQLATPANAEIVARIAWKAPIVLDTPLMSSSGAPLFDGRSDDYVALRAVATLVTPNAVEAFWLASTTLVSGRDAAESAARRLGRAVLLKGGHLDEDSITDVLFIGDRRWSWTSPRLPGRFRGTGCRLASAIAARLALGDDLPDAISAARAWLASELGREGGLAANTRGSLG